MQEKIHVAFCSDKNNIPFLAVALKSIVDNSSAENEYVVYVAHDGLTCYEYGYLRLLIKGRRNFELKFIDMNGGGYAKKFEHLFTSGHITLAAYWRFLLPEVLKDVNKLIYLDTDVVVIDDLSKLYDEDVSEVYCAGCLDIGVAKELSVSKEAREVLSSLGYKDFSQYINSGVLLINAEYARRRKIFNKMLVLANTNAFPFHDQDVINYTLMNEGGAKVLNYKWNFAIHKGFDTYPAQIVEDVIDRISKMDISIIHYIGSEKPWKCINRPLRELWVYYAAETPFFAGINLSPNSDVEKDIARSGKIRWGRRLEKLLIPKFIHQIKRNLLNKSEGMV